MIDELLRIMKDSGYEVYDDTKEELEEAIRNNKLVPIKINDIEIGFFTYLDEFKNNQKQIWINNLVVLKEYRNKNNLLFIKKYLRSLFPGGVAYWKNDRRGVYVYAR